MKERGKVVGVWVTPKEKRAYEKVAEMLDMSQSEVARLYPLKEVLRKAQKYGEAEQ